MAKTATKQPRKPRTIKAQRKPDKYLQSSISIIEGVGRFREKTRPFNYDRAIAEFHSWAYSAASMNANAVAANPLRLYVRSGGNRKKLYPTRPVPKHRKAWLEGRLPHRPGPIVRKNIGNMEDYEEVLDHPAMTLLHTVNGFENGWNATFLRQVYQQLTGNAYLHPVIGPAGVPDELWTMPSQWMWIIPSQKEFIDGYVYGQTARDARQRFEPDEVIHFKRPNPRNLFYGLGCVEACWMQLGIHNAQTAYDAATYENMARPDYLVAVKGGAASDALDRYEDEVNRKMRGAKNAGKMMAVSGDVSVTPLNWNPKDLGNTDRVVQIIATVFGVPLSKLQANHNVAGGQAGVSDHQYLKDTVHPLCVSDAEVLNAQYLPLFDIGEDAVLCYDDCVPADLAAETDRAVKLISIGAMTIDEYREDEGEDGIDDTPRFNGVPLAMMGQPTGLSAFMSPGGGSAMPPDAGAAPAGDEASPDAPAPAGVAVPGAEDTAPPSGNVQTTEASVLNGAQITAATAIVVSVASGEIPRDSGIGQLVVLFNLSKDQAEMMMGSAGTSKPTTPNPNPKEEAQQQAEAQAAEAKLQAVANTPPAQPASKVLDDAGVSRKTHEHLGVSGPGDDGPDGHGTSDEPDDPNGRESGPGGGEAAPNMAGPVGDGCPLGGCGAGDLGASPVKSWADAFAHFKSFASIRPETKAAPGSPGDEVVPRFQQDMERILREQILAAILALGSTADAIEAVQGALAALKDPRWQEALYAAAKPFVTSAISIGGNAGMSHPLLVERFGYNPFDVANPEVQAFVDRYTVRLASDVAEYTHVAAKDLLGDGLAQGESIQQLADRIRPWAEADPLTPSIGGAKYRSQMIARTESARAYVKGEQLAWKQTGVVTGKKWLLGPSPCAICEAAAAAFSDKPIPLDANFYEQGHTINTPEQSMTLDYEAIDGPPLHPQCVCDLIPSFEGE